MIRTHYRHWIYPVLALFLMMPALTAVVHAESHEHGVPTAEAGLYACPMHPEETGHKGDRCPKCNMFLTEIESDYACPMHPQETGRKGDRCPICNMFLVAEEEEEATDPPSHDHGSMDMGSQPMASPAAPAPTLIPVDSGPQGQVKYVCPMHPHIVSDEPGTCPICGMNLEKVDLGGSTEEVVVGVPGGMQQALGMRVQAIEKGTLWRYINTIGTVEYDQDAISHVHARVSGWIEKLGVASAGDEVKQGELLFELYSPDLVSAQDDFLLALDTLKRDQRRGGELIRKARLRLELLGMDAALIQTLERSGQTLYRVPFYAQHDGVISELNVRDGMYIQPSTEVLKLVDLNRVWVIAEVFENQQGWFRQGQAAAVTASALGLFELDGNIDYIYPELDPVTRAMQVRVALANPDGKLKPGSLVDVELYGTAKRNLTLIPTEALIQTGRNNRVVVQQSDTEFVVKEVQLGMIAKGMAEVLSGVNPGDRVVVSGQFLLDSEASLKGSLMRMSNGASDGHNH